MTGADSLVGQVLGQLADTVAPAPAPLLTPSPEPAAAAIREPEGRRPRWPMIAGAAAFSVVMLGVIIYVTTNKGTIKIEVENPKNVVVVKVDDNVVRLKALDEPITLSPGEHEVEVKWGDRTFRTARFTVVRGDDNDAVRIEYEPADGTDRLPTRAKSPVPAPAVGGIDGSSTRGATTPAQALVDEPPVPPAEAKAAEGGFQPLFNGKDLTGWKVYPSGTGNWKVHDGRLIGSGPPSLLFTVRDDYTNFHFRVEAKISDGGNSGQYFRVPFGPGFREGYEAQINSTHPDPVKTGSLYNLVNVKQSLVPPEAWFTQEVIADQNHIIIKVNGQTTADYFDPRWAYRQGHLALQQHHSGSVVEFRKIEVKELNPGTLMK
jgi:hypothetical protein